MKVTVLLRKDHETVKSLFTKYKKAGRSPNGKKEIFEEIRRELTIHSQMEAEIFYPALENTPSIEAGQFVASATEEHRAIEKLLDELVDLNPQEKQFDSKMSTLIHAVNRHIETEEGPVFEEVRKNLPEYRVEELGLEVEQRRKLISQLAA